MQLLALLMCTTSLETTAELACVMWDILLFLFTLFFVLYFVCNVIEARIQYRIFFKNVTWQTPVVLTVRSCHLKSR